MGEKDPNSVGEAAEEPGRSNRDDREEKEVVVVVVGVNCFTHLLTGGGQSNHQEEE